DTQPENGGPHSLWAQRAIKAHENSVENLAIIVPAVLVAHLLSISTPATKAAIVIYFLARLIHFFVYLGGVPVARTLAFTVGWVAQTVFLLSILRWICPAWPVRFFSSPALPKALAPRSPRPLQGRAVT